MELREEGRNTLNNVGNNFLKSTNNSLDHLVIQRLNDNVNLRDAIRDFTQQDIGDIIGTPVAKRIALEIINQIRSSEFSNTPNGETIYKAYTSFVKNTNVLILETNKCLEYDSTVLHNAVLYLIIGCDVDITGLKGFCSELYKILNAASGTVNLTPVITNDDIAALTSESIEENQKDTDKAIEDLKNLKKNLWRRALDAVKATLSGNPVIAGMQMACYASILGGASYTFVPLLVTKVAGQAFKFSERKSGASLAKELGIWTKKKEKFCNKFLNFCSYNGGRRNLGL